jgi:uncharacterized protein (TIGR02594 family)
MTVPADNADVLQQIPWLKIAYGECRNSVARYGTVDAKGGHHHLTGAAHDDPRILEYLRAAGISKKSGRLTEDTSWCSAFANWCIVKAGLVGPHHPAAARSWLKWQYGEKLAKPVVGAIAVYPRGKNPAYGHVAFIWEVKGDNYLALLGGNQGEHKADPKHHSPGVSSHVSISSRHGAPLGILWPKGYPFPTPATSPREPSASNRTYLA